MNKVCVINLEQGHPSVEEARLRLKNALATAKMSGKRAAIVVHGYGSTGTGGAIKASVPRILGDPALVGLVRDYVPGEAWESKKAPFLAACPEIRDQARYLSGNQGVTVVLLR